ncbi:hypothetical protein [Streptomyces sp. SD31]|uniref:hypothetical protein n=1 Tax=Streptomyces sp. SD31 TaxID=3452208 RepID=UPI003F899153
MEEAERPDFPRHTSARPWTLRLRTENVVVLDEEVALLREEFLPGWRTRLPDGSPMVELIDLYVRGAQPVLRHVEAVRVAWDGVVLPEPAIDDVARHARYSGAPTDEVTARLWFETAARWEERSDRRSLWEAMEPAWNHLGDVRSTVMAAVSGDVEY